MKSRVVALLCLWAAWIGTAGAQKVTYQAGILLDVAAGEHIDTIQTNYIQIPPMPSIGSAGASVPITTGVKGTPYDITVRVGDVVCRARVGFTVPADLVINDPVQVRFATVNEHGWKDVLYVLRPGAAKYKDKDKEYKAYILSRARVVDAPAPASPAALPPVAPPPVAFAPPLAPPVPPPPPPPVPPAAPGLPDAAETRDACVQRKVAASCTLLGEMYHEGAAGLPKDGLRAATYLKQGCDGGHLRGCAALALVYAIGEAVAKNPAKALELSTRACDGGIAGGCFVLGSLYVDGLGVGKDVVRGAALLKGACDGELALACSVLGSLYDEGGGLPLDYTAAAILYQQACDRKSMNACDSRGRLFELGRGVPKHTNRALELYELACSAGDTDACGHRDALKRKP